VSTASPEKRPFLESPKNQRRLLLVAAVVLATAVATLLIVFVRNTGDAKETFSDDPANTFQQPKTVNVDPEARRVAGRFILTAVARKQLGASYDLVHPALRQGMSRDQWKGGTIPVVYFPAEDLDFASFKVEYSFPDDVMLEVLLVPNPKENVRPASFFVGLKRVGGDDGPWKVYYWAPSYRPAVPDPG
jgi:hypothetical protein